ncbi:MAG: trigger factor [Actinomycetota bacterium]
MKTTLEALEGNKIKLSIEVDEIEFDRYLDGAFRKISTQIRIPGFRQGKAPRQLIEAQIGVEAARSQAIEDAIPASLALAVREHDLDIIATPEVNLTGGQETGNIVFDATCEVRPVVEIPGYKNLKVEMPALVASDEDIDEVVKYERKRHATLTDVDRAAKVDDQVTLDLVGSRDGQPLPGLNVDDWLYEVGRGWVAEDFDKQLIGATTGQKLEFTSIPSGMTETADFVVTVKKIQEQVLPELTDEWVAEHLAEHETIEEWKSAVRTRIEESRLNQVRNTVVEKTTAALAALLEIEAPEAMVNGDLRGRVQNTLKQFESQGISMEQWLSVTQQTAEQFVDALKEQSVLATKVDIALRAVAVAEKLEASEDDLERQFSRIATQLKKKPVAIRKAYEKNDAIVDLKAQIAKSKAIDWLLHNSQFVDDKGNAIDAETILGEHNHDDIEIDTDAHDHDHEHDHSHEHDHKH